jgi:hypothetical protein
MVHTRVCVHIRLSQSHNFVVWPALLIQCMRSDIWRTNHVSWADITRSTGVIICMCVCVCTKTEHRFPEAEYSMLPFIVLLYEALAYFHLFLWYACMRKYQNIYAHADGRSASWLHSRCDSRWKTACTRSRLDAHVRRGGSHTGYRGCL